MIKKNVKLTMAVLAASCILSACANADAGTDSTNVDTTTKSAGTSTEADKTVNETTQGNDAQESGKNSSFDKEFEEKRQKALNKEMKCSYGDQFVTFIDWEDGTFNATADCFSKDVFNVYPTDKLSLSWGNSLYLYTTDESADYYSVSVFENECGSLACVESVEYINAAVKKDLRGAKFASDTIVDYQIVTEEPTQMGRWEVAYSHGYYEGAFKGTTNKRPVYAYTLLSGNVGHLDSDEGNNYACTFIYLPFGDEEPDEEAVLAKLNYFADNTYLIKYSGRYPSISDCTAYESEWVGMQDTDKMIEVWNNLDFSKVYTKKEQTNSPAADIEKEVLLEESLHEMGFNFPKEGYTDIAYSKDFLYKTLSGFEEAWNFGIEYSNLQIYGDGMIDVRDEILLKLGEIQLDNGVWGVYTDYVNYGHTLEDGKSRDYNLILKNDQYKLTISSVCVGSRDKTGWYVTLQELLERFLDAVY